MKRKAVAASAALSLMLQWNGMAGAKPGATAPVSPPTPPVREHVAERQQPSLGDLGEAERTMPHVVGRLPFGLEMPEPAMALYRAAQTHERDGRREQARFLFQQVHLMSPTSWCGQQAMRQLQDMEGGFGAEESEEPPMPSFGPRGPSAPVLPTNGALSRSF
ncbi:MAG: hypothetical protein K2X38_24515 [Gemmataceae bacterium]|nr:hypothetical protein [Gemmataceae bacterium]